VLFNTTSLFASRTSKGLSKSYEPAIPQSYQPDPNLDLPTYRDLNSSGVNLGYTEIFDKNLTGYPHGFTTFFYKGAKFFVSAFKEIGDSVTIFHVFRNENEIRHHISASVNAILNN
jgi:hypothetical protein